MVLVSLLLFLVASATAQMNPKALRPCFERYPNHRLVNLKPYHSEWRMRTEESCLQFCSDTRSRCRSIVYDSVQHICHYFLDDGNDFTIPAAKMIYMRVANSDCLDHGQFSSSETNNVDSSSREIATAPPLPIITSEQFVIPETPTAIIEKATEESALETTTDMFADFTTPASPFEESAYDNAEEDFEMEKLGRKNELMRDINGLENQDKRWQSSMEQLVKNTEDFAFKGTRIPSPVKIAAVRVEPKKAEPIHEESASLEPMHEEPEQIEPARVQPVRVEPMHEEPEQVEPARVQPVRVEPMLVDSAHVKPVRVEPMLMESISIRERPTTNAPATAVGSDYIEEKLQQKIVINTDAFLDTTSSAQKSLNDDSVDEDSSDLLKRRYPSRYAQYLAEKEAAFGKYSASPSSSSSNEDTFTLIPTVDNSLSIDDAEVIAPMIPMRPKKNRRAMFAGKRIAFSDDHMFSRKIDGADIRRQQQAKLKQVTLGGPTPPSYVDKARSFLEMVNTKKSRSHGVKSNVVDAQLDSSAMVTSAEFTGGCSKDKLPIWMTFENSVGSELIDSNYVEDWDACRRMCENDSCNSFTFYDDQQCMVNVEDEGVNLRPPPMGPYTAKTTLKFCYPDSVAPFHGCSNFVAFRDYSLKTQPQEAFEGLPPGYDGLKLCVELCVLSTEYSCRSATFEMLDGLCKLYSVDSISAPTAFEPTHVMHQLYFENGCTSQHELSPVDRSFAAIERVPMKDSSSPKALQIKPIKLKKRRLHRRMKSTGSMDL